MIDRVQAARFVRIELEAIVSVHQEFRQSTLERPEPFEVEVRPARRRVVVAPRGELDIATTGRLQEEIDSLVEAGFDDMVLDLRGLSFMDSTGLNLVVRQAQRPDVTLRLIDGSAPVARLFDVTHLRETLPFLAPHEVLRAP